MMVGRNKTYESLVTVNVTIQPFDLARLDNLPGASRNERIRYLLAVHDAALRVTQADDVAAAVAELKEIIR